MSMDSARETGYLQLCRMGASMNNSVFVCQNYPRESPTGTPLLPRAADYIIRMWILWVILPSALAGCSHAAIQGPVAGLQGVASMLADVSSTAAGLKQTQSTVELNGANQRLIEAQAAMTQTQVEQTRDDHARLINERKVTARLLRVMSIEYHEPLFETLAVWVEAGGDPDFAFKYALSRANEEQTTQEQPSQTLSLAQHPQLSPAMPSDSLPEHRRLLIDKTVSEKRETTGGDQSHLSINGGE